MTARRVPQILTSQQKQARMECCRHRPAPVNHVEVESLRRERSLMFLIREQLSRDWLDMQLILAPSLSWSGASAGSLR
ncbi:hypothetical protein EVAR_68430_1 [Eumeta japonica]|uniref:Uncharacterized protein n=1 Tax=Eumeta variegata TaxID=151549 RepID=A0A4C2A5Y0_EUMVA|nr:hypothetical protein EVAR_68430_1 [Eumeta japonica]